MENRYRRIDDLLGLHQELDIHYVVDGYDATLRNANGYAPIEFTGHGETIEAALIHLNAVLIAEVHPTWMAIDLKNDSRRRALFFYRDI